MCGKKKEKKNKQIFFAADFETTYHKEFSTNEFITENRDTGIEPTADKIDLSPDSKSEVFLAGLKPFNSDDYFLSYENIPDFLNNITMYLRQNNCWEGIIYFHNLKYDGSYIHNWLLRNNYKQTLKVNQFNRPVINYKEYTLFSSGGKYYELSFKWRTCKLIFRDSLKLLPISLDKLGELVSKKKLKETVDYKQFRIIKNHDYPKQWLDYLKRDVDILAAVLETMGSHDSRFLKKLTIGSISYNSIQSTVKTLNKETFYKKHFDYFNLYYQGGICYPNYELMGTWQTGKIRMIDAVSMYPSQMINELPYDLPNHKKQNKDDIAFVEVCVYEFKIKNKYRSIPMIKRSIKQPDGSRHIIMKDKNELNEYLTEFVNEQGIVFYWTKKEFDLIKKLYNIDYTIQQTWWFKSKKYLADQVGTMFVEKQQAALNNESSKKFIAKLKLNNLYGKLAQHYDRPQDFYGELKDIPEEYITSGKMKTINHRHAGKQAYVIKKEITETTKTKPVHIAAYITSLARISLITKAKEIIDKGGTFLYCDTDSVCYIDNTDIKFNDIGNNLGDWEYEKFKDNITTAHGFKSLCPKQYRVVFKGQDYPVKHASAGINKEIIAQVKNKHYNYDMDKHYNLVKKALKVGQYGNVIVDTTFDFKKYKNKQGATLPKELE